MEVKEFRYPGVLPFQDTDLHRKLFWGRETEAKSLFHLVLSVDHVVIFAKSGMGKTSLINVGLIEPLRNSNYLPLLVRLNNPQKEPLENIYEYINEHVNRYKVEFKPGDKSHLWNFFKTSEFWEGNTLLTPVLIIDQFEELFTLNYPKELKLKLAKQLSSLVSYGIPTDVQSKNKSRKFNLSEVPPTIKIIFSLRESFLSNLEELSPYFPGIFQNRFWLGPLTIDNAREAIEKPALLKSGVLHSSPFFYSEDVVATILKYLGRYRSAPHTTKTEKGVEPYQIQLICQYIENLVIKSNKSTIDSKNIGGEEGIRNIITNFYDKQINQLGSGKERRIIRRLCEKGLISERGYRLSLEEGEIKKNHGVTDEHLKKLIDCRLLRAESRIGSNYYELSHDTLIEPIVAAAKTRENTKKKKIFVSLLTIGVIVLCLTFIIIESKKKSIERLNQSLHDSVNRGYNIDVFLYIKEGADPNSKNSKGYTPLSIAAETGNKRILSLLIDKGANINAPNVDGSTPLITAIKTRNRKIVGVLSEKGANINLTDNDGDTPLIIAAKTGQEKIVRLLLKKKALINLKNKFGDTPLIVASKAGNKKIVKILLEKGAGINLENKFGDTPLIVAAKAGHEDTASLFLEKGAKINQANKFGDTSLMLATYWGHTNLTKLLLDKGAEVNLVNNIGDTALIDAAKIGNVEMGKMLVKNGADLNLKNKLMMKAWHWAKKKGHREMTDFLEMKTQIRIRNLRQVLLYKPFPEKYIPKNINKLVSEGINFQRQAYKSGDNFCSKYTQAFKKILIAAETSKDAFAMYLISRAYTYGLGVNQDFSQAFNWTKKAAELGDTWGQSSLAFFYQYGLGTDVNCKESLKWFQKSVAQDNPWGAVGLGDMYLYGCGNGIISSNSKKALYWFQKAAKQGEARAQNNLGDLYRRGIGGVKESLENATQCFEEASKQGDIYANHRVGQGKKKSFEQAFRLFLEVAKKNFDYAQYFVGWAYEHGEGVEQSFVEAVKWYRLAAGQRRIEAESRLKKLGRKL